MGINKELTPKKIVEELNKYIISQDEAKKNVAISLRNRDRRKMIEDENLRKEITPKNIILIGSTGVGKTEIARRIAKIANAPFLKVEATKYTEVGYVGKDVESIIKDLVALTYRKMKEEKYGLLKLSSLDAAIERVAKILKPYDTLNDEDKEIIKKAFEKSIPIMCSYLFVSIAYGVMMNEAGFAWYVAILVSFLIYTGAFQFLLITLLIGGGTSLLTIGVTAFLMNSRQLFYSLSFIDVFNKMKQKWYMIFTMTDETYAVNCNLEDQDKEQVMFYVALFSRCY